MSIQPQNYLHTTIKDFDFMRKYKLTPSQTDIMSYLRNLTSWAEYSNSYYLLTANKIRDDLQLKQKNIEASFTKLKKLGLIKTKMIPFEKWSKHKKYRGVKITELGMKYNLSFLKPKEKKIVVDLKAELKKSEEKNLILVKEIERLQDELKAEKQSKKICQLPPKNIGKNEPYKSRSNNTITKEVNKDLITEQGKNGEKPFSKFKFEIIKKFGDSNLPICNEVAGWDFQTQFVINSYNKLSIIIPNGKYKQLVNPKEINDFWRWLFKNQNRVGEVREMKKAKIEDLMLFIGFFVLIADKKYEINDIQKKQNGVTIKLKDEFGKIKVMENNKKRVLNMEKCKQWLKNKAFRE